MTFILMVYKKATNFNFKSNYNSKYVFSFQCVVIFLVFDAEAYVSEESLPALLVILFLYG